MFSRVKSLLPVFQAPTNSLFTPIASANCCFVKPFLVSVFETLGLTELSRGLYIQREINGC